MTDTILSAIPPPLERTSATAASREIERDFTLCGLSSGKTCIDGVQCGWDLDLRPNPQRDSIQLFRNPVAWLVDIHAWRGSTASPALRAMVEHGSTLQRAASTQAVDPATPAMYLALSLMRSARRIAGADGPASNSDRP
ncbi:TPA: hypothetical protein ACKQBZ_003502 [Stenotrophomonas maltophilia]|uniref:Uncharacterized protein n=1 Tax=Stenotrophomonas maltophilia TaxID=40324 RepID=A0AAJ2JG40_STEMA|nr:MULTISPECIES: hypothetical protein [Stenotrophomonas]MDQ7281506.1 hypothetical protein [Stenotrophomonas sp. Sm6012]MDT3469237.1 hypothetical protein [Stenotrophomonas maltophilia]